MEKKGQSGHLGGFTLIEMLVVIVIIAILIGVVFRLSSATLAKASDAKETARVAIFKTLIEEFYAEYGIYPPVPEYGGVQPIDFKGPFPENGQDLAYWLNHYKSEEVFVFGLMSFFVSRPDYGSQTFSSEVGGRNRDDVRGSWEGYNDKIPASGVISQSSKDKAFVKRVKPIVDQLGPRSAGAEFDENGHTFGFDTAILDVRVRGDKYVYISEPPYASYIFFNMGADGEYDHGAPGDRSKPKNRDNIYATLEDD